MKILFQLPEHFNGSDYHRIATPMVAFMANKDFETARCVDVSRLSLSQLKEYDVLVVSRLITSYPELHDITVQKVKKSGIKVIVDLDDYWMVEKSHPTYDDWIMNGTEACIKETLDLANRIWTTQPKLAKAIQTIADAPVLVVKNGIGENDTQFENFIKPEATTDYLRIGLTCLPNHWHDFSQIKPTIKKLNKLTGWKIHCIGVSRNYEYNLANLIGTDRLEFQPFFPPTEYAKHYNEIDVMICPLVKNRYNRYRSDIKIAEAAFTNTPIITENYAEYAGTPYAWNNWDGLINLVKAHNKHGIGALDGLEIPNKKDFTTVVPNGLRFSSVTNLLEKNEPEITSS